MIEIKFTGKLSEIVSEIKNFTKAFELAQAAVTDTKPTQSFSGMEALKEAHRRVSNALEAAGEIRKDVDAILKENQKRPANNPNGPTPVVDGGLKDHKFRENTKSGDWHARKKFMGDLNLLTKPLKKGGAGNCPHCNGEFSRLLKHIPHCVLNPINEEKEPKTRILGLPLSAAGEVKG